MKQKILRRGFEILRSRTSSNDLNILDFEKNSVLKLPPKFRIFIDCFELGEDGENAEKYFNKKANQVWYCSGSYIDLENEITFEKFNSIEEIFKYSDADPRWQEEGLLPIGSGGMNEVILLGTRTDRIDKIYMHHADILPEFRLFADDIFQFVKKFVQTEFDERTIWGGFKYSQFYKHWGDQEWQVKD